MAKRDSVFADDWRECLEAHYLYVIQKQDKLTETSLTPILQSFGFTEDDLRRLYLQATMKADALPEGFIPDETRVLGDSAPVQAVPDGKTFQVHPAECQCAACMDVVLDIGHDKDGQPVEATPEPEEAQGNLFPVAKVEKKPKAEKPKQKSMF